MSLKKTLAKLFQHQPRAAPPLPVPTLVRAAPYTPTPAPVIAPDPYDLAVQSKFFPYMSNPAGFIPALEAELRTLEREIAELEAELARLQTLPRFVP